MMTSQEHDEALLRLAADADAIKRTDAIVVLALLAARLRQGHLEHGILDLDADERPWPEERLAEALDRAIYTVFDDLTALRRGRAGR